MAPTEPEEEEYEVEEVLDYRTIGSRTQYLLKWKDYPVSESTWEWEENLKCPDLLEKFKANLLLATGVKRKSVKVSPLNPKAYVGPCPIGRSHPATYKGPYQYRFHKYYS